MCGWNQTWDAAMCNEEGIGKTLSFFDIFQKRGGLKMDSEAKYVQTVSGVLPCCVVPMRILTPAVPSYWHADGRVPLSRPPGGQQHTVPGQYVQCPRD